MLQHANPDMPGLAIDRIFSSKLALVLSQRWVTGAGKQKGLQGKTLQAFVLIDPVIRYSTVTDFAKLRGWSTSVPLIKATW